MDFQNLRIWKDTHKFIRRICAETGETIVAMLHRVLIAEWERVKPKS